jgi:hypothetical protein
MYPQHPIVRYPQHPIVRKTIIQERVDWTPQELIQAIKDALLNIPVNQTIDTDTLGIPSYLPVEPFEEYCEDPPIENYLQVNALYICGFLNKWNARRTMLYTYKQECHNSRFSQSGIKALESSIFSIKTKTDMENFRTL